MGLTNSSVGLNSAKEILTAKKKSPDDIVIALAGNPNVGKSTVFNALTGMNQHTGNWPGKTVSCAQGYFSHEGKNFVLVDLPGTYSLLAHSPEEEVARDFICFGKSAAIIVVCDAGCIERSMNLLLQVTEINKNVILCVNLMDEAKKKKINIDPALISKRLGIKVIATSARSNKGIEELKNALLDVTGCSYEITYGEKTEQAISLLESETEKFKDIINPRFLALRLLSCEDPSESSLMKHISISNEEKESLALTVSDAKASVFMSGDDFEDDIVKSLIKCGEEITAGAIEYQNGQYSKRDEKIDRILTGKIFAFPAMFLLLALVFYITITFANYPSSLLSMGFTKAEEYLYGLILSTGCPVFICDFIFKGVFRVVGWIVSVMLPPMAIFFPLFTLLEDWGYLPRVAFNLDRCFKKCDSCGKQSLTMCMGFGCNAAGVVGCRIIDSERERLIAILTNAFVPCNGRFPAMITLITVFFVGFASGVSGFLSALYLALIIVAGIGATLLASKLLSKTVLKGKPSFFTLEMPSYRRPQIAKTLVRSIFDRTIFVLGRAVVVAIPAGAIIWILSNVTVGDVSVLNHISSFLDPAGRLLGMDGVILMAFILGLPANEIVIPIAIMAYTSSGALTEIGDVSLISEILTSNGWTPVTALCVIVFSLMHSPCTTTLLTVKKETGSIKWTAVAAILPTMFGIVACLLINLIASIF
ncbi:MAG: ferrous iron transport protein B [Eubacteriales bacterium]